MGSIGMTMSPLEAQLAWELMARLKDARRGVSELLDKIRKSVDGQQPVELTENEVKLCVEACDEFDATLWFAGFDREKGPLKDTGPSLPEQHRELCLRMKAVLDSG